MVRRHADVTSVDSLSNRLRARRFLHFQSLIQNRDRPIRIIDVGGTLEYWKHRSGISDHSLDITVVNLEADVIDGEHLRSRPGDATDLRFVADGEYDVAFSNSVIEHLFTKENQEKMAAEIQRVANAYYVQTPNYWFPIEPHFLFPGWQWLPVAARSTILSRFRVGQRGPYTSTEAARRAVEEIQLLTEKELVRLFPGASVWKERFFGLTKSLVVYRGFADDPN